MRLPKAILVSGERYVQAYETSSPSGGLKSLLKSMLDAAGIPHTEEQLFVTPGAAKWEGKGRLWLEIRRDPSTKANQFWVHAPGNMYYGITPAKNKADAIKLLKMHKKAGALEKKFIKPPRWSLDKKEADSAPFDADSLERIIRSRLTSFVNAVFGKTFTPAQLKTQVKVVPLNEGSATLKCGFLHKATGIAIEITGKPGRILLYKVIVPVIGKEGRSKVHKFEDYGWAIKSALHHLAQMKGHDVEAP